MNHADDDQVQEQIRLLTHVVSQLVLLVARLNVEAYMDTTPLHHAAEQREQDFRDVNEALENLRATLGAWISQLDAAQEPAPERGHDVGKPS